MPRQHWVVETTIRKATLRDAAAVTRIHLETAIAAYSDIFPSDAPAPTYEELLSVWTDWLTNADAIDRNLIAVQNGSMVGIGRAGPDPADPSVGHLSRVYVHPESWGLGAGTALYGAALDHLRAAGFTTATLWVLEHNSRARSWYERLGWHATGHRKSVFAPSNIDDVRYRFDL